jgi:hypothetical protein
LVLCLGSAQPIACDGPKGRPSRGGRELLRQHRDEKGRGKRRKQDGERRDQGDDGSAGVLALVD